MKRLAFSTKVLRGVSFCIKPERNMKYEIRDKLFITIFKKIPH